MHYFNDVHGGKKSLEAWDMEYIVVAHAVDEDGVRKNF